MSSSPEKADSTPLRDDVLEGLARPQKSIPCKYLYDARGSELFEQICNLEEYYPTRTELKIMESHADEMAERLGSRVRLVEFGAGSGLKTELLLEALDNPAAYLPVEISEAALDACAVRLERAFPELEIAPVCADYTHPLELPAIEADFERTAVYYPGSTLGNFTRPQARRFLERIAAVAGEGGAALIGIDLRKDPEILEPAYDDKEGVTAAFALNLLRRLNRELDADFDLDQFRHRAIWNGEDGCIETHLVSTREQTVAVDDQRFSFDEGEHIIIEYSYKYTLDGFEALVNGAGLRAEQLWTDERDWFSVWYLER